MVQAKNVTWDIVDSGLGGTGELGPLGLLEEIDYSIVDKNKVTPGFAYKYAICNYMFSYVMAFNAKRFGLKALPIKVLIPPRPVGVVTLKNRTLSPLAALFIDCARAFSRPFAQSAPTSK